MSEKEMYLGTRQYEIPVTVKVLSAYPADKLTWRPHERSKSAQELMMDFSAQQEMITKIITTGRVGMDNEGAHAQQPMQAAELIAKFQSTAAEAEKAIMGASDAAMNENVDFFGSPMRRGQVLWIMLFDMIHHRGQMSVYIRLAGGKVPSIYGPSADDPGPAAAK